MMPLNQRLAILILVGLVIQGLHYNNLYAQDIRIDFSVEERVDTLGCVTPVLRIEYINSGSKNYYFPALFSLKSSKPRYATVLWDHDWVIGDRRVSQKTFDYCKKVLYANREYQGQHYYLLLEFLDTHDTIYYFITEEFTLEDEFLNYYLYAINRFRLEIENSKEWDIDVDAFTESMLKNYHELKESGSFVFLRKNESLVQYVSLRGLEKTGVILTVRLQSCYVPQEVRIGLGKNKTCSLSDTIQDFQLYKGIIESNPVTVTFSE